MPGDVAAIMTMPTTRSPSQPAFARVEIHRNPAAVFEAWAELEASAPCSIYQTRDWLLPWIATLGRKAGIKPLFILGRSQDGRPVALLSLGIVRRGPLRIASWLGGFDANFNMPLVRSDVVWTRPELLRLLREAAKACDRDAPDLFNLVNQPFDWGGRPNPLASLPHQIAPSAAFGTALPVDAETFFLERLSRHTRKKLRKKEANLAALGPLRHLVVTEAAAQRRVIDAFLTQKVARFRAQKVVSEFETPEMRDFITAASQPSGAGIELHALLVGDRIIAVYGGGAHAGQWSGMFNSFDGDEEIAKSSPGDLLLMRIVRKACADGLTRLDLGIGEARYKAALCDECVPLFDTIVPISLGGLIVARFLSVRQSVKRAIKANPRLFALAKTIRSLGA